MSQVADVAAVSYVVVTAWECDACDVAGRSIGEPEVSCWNCDGPVIVTARPAIKADEL